MGFCWDNDEGLDNSNAFFWDTDEGLDNSNAFFQKGILLSHVLYLEPQSKLLNTFSDNMFLQQIV